MKNAIDFGDHFVRCAHIHPSRGARGTVELELTPFVRPGDLNKGHVFRLAMALGPDADQLWKEIQNNPTFTIRIGAVYEVSDLTEARRLLSNGYTSDAVSKALDILERLEKNQNA